MRQLGIGTAGFASHIANQIRRQRPKVSQKWHLDEMRGEITRRSLLARGVRSMNKVKSEIS